MNFCLDQNDHVEFAGQPVFTTVCSNEAGNQYWWLNGNNFLMRDYMCIGVLPDGYSVVVMDCAKVMLNNFERKVSFSCFRCCFANRENVTCVASGGIS